MKTLLVTIGIVVAGIAYAGDLDPPKGPITPTMHTLDEIYDAVTNPPTWEYKFLTFGDPQEIEIVAGEGVLHAVWANPENVQMMDVQMFDGPPANGVKIGQIRTQRAGAQGFLVTPIFMELDVQFTNGLFIQASRAAATVLYKQ